MLKKWKTLSRNEVYKNPYWTAYHDIYETGNGKKGDYYSIKYNGGVEIIALRNDGRIILVEQYRYLYDRPVISFPGGSIQQGKSAEETACLELLEETGYVAGSLKYLGERFISPGLLFYIDTFFLARDLEQKTPKPEKTEEFIYHYKTPDEIDLMMTNSEILSGNATCAWTLARPFLSK